MDGVGKNQALTVDSEVRAAQGSNAAQYSLVRSAVHPVSSQAQHQSGRALVSAAAAASASAVASVVAANACGLVKMGDGEGNVLIYDVGGGIFDGSLLIVEDGIFEERSSAR